MATLLTDKETNTLQSGKMQIQQQFKGLISVFTTYEPLNNYVFFPKGRKNMLYNF